MLKPADAQTLIQQLNELGEEPEEQSAFAAAMIEMELNHQELAAAAKVLAENPNPRARRRLSSLYKAISADGVILDPGAEVRTWLIHALRPISKPVDSELFESAALTYEYLPPQFMEEAGLLRIAGTAALSDVDDELAIFHASRMLVDNSTDRMSGEPAVSAARLLASLDAFASLYQFLFYDFQKLIPEVVSECLGQLTSISTSLIPGLIEKYGDSESDLILAGLFDLLLGHSDGVQGGEFIQSFLAQSKRYDVYRYVVTLIVAERRQDLLPALLPLFHKEKNKEKVSLLLEALDPLRNDPEVSKIIKNLTGTKEK